MAYNMQSQKPSPITFKVIHQMKYALKNPEVTAFQF